MTPSLPLIRPRSALAPLLLIALFVTGLNAFKPLAMDDALYGEYARQIAHHPFDPYGFQVFWTQWPESANWVLPPPVLPYWWAMAMRWFGPSVVVWKLWLFPWIATFVFAVHALLKRFAPSVAVPMTVFTVFAPVFLPAINYMLDVPALGLGLAGLCVSVWASDRRSIGLAVLAGLLLGVAMQTKYTAATLPVVAAVYGFTRRRWILAVLPGLVAASVFVGWEIFIAKRYGQSHFLIALRGTDVFNGRDPRAVLIETAVTLIGGIGGPLALMMLFALGAAGRRVAYGTAVVIAAVVLTAAGPAGMWTSTVLGIGFWGVFAAVLWAIARRHGAAETRRDDGFLLCWFAIEAAGFVAISPFGATRRLMGMLLVLTLLTARLLENRLVTRQTNRTFRRLVGFGVAMGLVFFAVDWIDARAMRSAADAAAAVVTRFQQPGQRAYYKGHWGFQFYCERAGMLPIVPDHTVLRPGDWVVYPTTPINMQSAVLPVADIVAVGSVSIDDPIALETEPAFYGRYVALDHRTGPRMALVVYQITAPCVPRTNLSPQDVIHWAITRPQPLMPMSVTSVLSAMKQTDRDSQEAAARVIIAGGADTLIEASRDVDPRSRRWAAAQLGKLPATPALTAALQVELNDNDPAVRVAAAKALRRG